MVPISSAMACHKDSAIFYVFFLNSSFLSLYLQHAHIEDINAGAAFTVYCTHCYCRNGFFYGLMEMSIYLARQRVSVELFHQINFWKKN